ncbi:MAG TPA: hypothetical protein VEL28_10995 [Candidatus Binatia bacterium]|nr:hypothetical protein [Candidatus Binatia bacterium]
MSSLLLVAAASTPVDAGGAGALLASDVALRFLGLAVFLGSTALLLMTSRRDWKRLAERERRAPGLLTSLGLEVRGAHGPIDTRLHAIIVDDVIARHLRSCDATLLERRRELESVRTKFAQILGPQPRGI